MVLLLDHVHSFPYELHFEGLQNALQIVVDRLLDDGAVGQVVRFYGV